jgi:hypothetical protein
MTLEEAEECLRNSPSGGIRHIVANEDGSFSIVGQMPLSESQKLEESFYDTVVVAAIKTRTVPGSFLHLLKAAAAEPIILRKLIHDLVANYRPPRSKKDPEMVIRVRTRDAYKIGYLRRVK